MYAALKTLHVLSAAILFGTGLGTAWFLWMANRSRDLAAMTVVTGHVIAADLYFTTPAIVVQPASGFAMLWLLGVPIDLGTLNWVSLSLLLYLLAGACWLPVVWLQWRMHRILRSQPASLETYWRYARLWTLLGIPAFASLVVVFWLMVAKPF